MTNTVMFQGPLRQKGMGEKLRGGLAIQQLLPGALSPASFWVWLCCDVSLDPLQTALALWNFVELGKEASPRMSQPIQIFAPTLTICNRNISWDLLASQ